MLVLPPPRWRFRADRCEDWRELARLLEELHLTVEGRANFERVEEAGLAHLFERVPDGPTVELLDA